MHTVGLSAGTDERESSDGDMPERLATTKNIFKGSRWICQTWLWKPRTTLNKSAKATWSISFTPGGCQSFSNGPDPQSHVCPTQDSQVLSLSQSLEAYGVTGYARPSCPVLNPSLITFPARTYSVLPDSKIYGFPTQSKQVYELCFKLRSLNLEL